LHSAKSPSAAKNRLCNGDRQDWRLEWRTIVNEKNLVFVLVSTQMQMLRLLDAVEDNLLLCRKQEDPPPPLGTLAGDGHSGGPADSVACLHFADVKPVCGGVLERLSG
jgi:hypothetical protein